MYWPYVRSPHHLFNITFQTLKKHMLGVLSLSPVLCLLFYFIYLFIFLKILSFGLFAFIPTGQLRIWQEGGQRERGWHAADGPQVGVEPTAAAEDWQPQYMERTPYQLIHKGAPIIPILLVQSWYQGIWS